MLWFDKIQDGGRHHFGFGFSAVSRSSMTIAQKTLAGILARYNVVLLIFLLTQAYNDFALFHVITREEVEIH